MRDCNCNLEELEAAYEQYASECHAALRLTLARIENLQQLQVEQNRNPISSTKSRIKTFNSVLDKCERREYSYDIESIREKIRDVAGIRIITTFMDDIYLIMDMLEHIPGINVTRRKDYVAKPKASGYRSLHLEIQVEIYCTKGGSKLIPVEIQIRDKAMDYWAAVEHRISYKKETPDPETAQKLKDLADYLAESDRMAQELHDKNPAD